MKKLSTPSIYVIRQQLVTKKYLKPYPNLSISVDSNDIF